MNINFSRRASLEMQVIRVTVRGGPRHRTSTYSAWRTAGADARRKYKLAPRGLSGQGR